MEKVSQIIHVAVKNLFNANAEISLSRPDAKFGDYATNVAMQLAKSLGRNPREIAGELCELLRKNDEFSEVEIAGPGFINLRISAHKIASDLDEAFSQNNFGENNDGAGKTVVVEYPSPNMAKPYSVGHLRSGNQGWAARNLMLATGWNVITDNHLGDYGAPFGYWVLGFRKFSSDEQLASGGIYELGRVYVAIRAELKSEQERGDDTLAKEAQDWLLKLENGDLEAVELSEKFNRISLEHIHEIMGRLRISTDYELGEKFYVERGKNEVAKLLESGIAKRNEDGSVIVELDGFDTPILVQKSNGAALYATTDLATMVYREREWHADRAIIATGAEQVFYFQQLAALAKKIGVKTELTHLWFGVIDQLNDDGTREKMSSRKGVVLMEELLNVAEAKARQNTKGEKITDDDVRKIALGAIKFTDFSQDRRTNILFDWDQMFSLTGFSGPYVQYAAVRVNKILRDNADVSQAAVGENYDFAKEKDVLLKLAEYPEVVRTAANLLEPHRVAQYVYDLAKVMNRYYETTPIATDTVSQIEKSARLELLRKVSYVFAHGLQILGIEVPERM